MSIDTQSDTRTNIKDLALNTPPKEIQPAWHVNVSSDEWNNLDQSIRSYHDTGGRHYPAEVLASAAILGSSEQFSTELNDEDYGVISIDLIRRKSGTGILKFDMGEVSLAAWTKILFPEKNIVTDTDISAEFILSIVKRHGDQPDWLSQGIINYAILFPDQLGILRKTGIEESLLGFSRDSDSLISIKSNTALRLAFPDGYKRLDEPYLKKMQKSLESIKNHGENDFLPYAAYLKILAADGVILNDNGLQLIYNKEPLPNIQESVPEVRKF